MAMKQTRLYFKDLAAKLKTKFSISCVWFISLNVADVTLIIWKHADPDPVQCDILLKCISNTSKILEVFAMKEGSLYVRLMLEPKLMDRKTSKIALGGAPSKAAAATGETDSEEECEIARDIKASQRHEAERMAEAKAAKSTKSGKDKCKTVVKEAPKKKSSVPM
ncbi:hypothetical protein R1sor_027147 [Riccia sorocarpa]|uniref:Uncharacterized protein n=1 Tax=Riccia sorocarpa TaxID=122646 RepID=A0ABD3GHL6_9MARC